ncbi:MAG: hypothetical protein ACOCSG_04170 [Guyparkeria sp.]
MLQLSPSRHANVVAALVILLLLAVIGTIMLGQSKLRAVAGPTAIAADRDGRFHFLADGFLHAATAEGEVTHRTDLASLGLGGRVPDMQVSGDGRFLLVGDADAGTIAWCARDLSGCPRHTPLPPGTGGRVFHFHHDATRQRIFVLTGDPARLDELDTDGRRVRQLSVPGGLDHSNTVRSGRDGTLVIADTNAHRIVAIDPDETAATPVLEFRTDTGDGRPDRNWPVAAVQDGDGSIWMISTDGMLGDGDLLLVDPDRPSGRLIGMPENADPRSLAVVPGGVLVADHGNPGIYHAGPDSDRAERLAHPTLDAVFAPLMEARNDWQRWISAGWLLVALALPLGVLAAVLDWRTRREQEEERQRRAVLQEPSAVSRPGRKAGTPESDPPENAIEPDGEGVIWLRPDPAFLRRMRWLAMGMTGIAVAGMLPMMLIVATETDDWTLLAMMAGLGLFLVLLAIASLLGIRRLRIGWDGETLRLVGITGREERIAPEDAVLTGQRLVGRRIAVPLVNGKTQRAVFDRAQFDHYLRPILKTAEQHSEIGHFWNQLRDGRPAAWGQLVAIGLMLAAVIWLESG